MNTQPARHAVATHFRKSIAKWFGAWHFFAHQQIRGTSVSTLMMRHLNFWTLYFACCSWERACLFRKWSRVSCAIWVAFTGIKEKGKTAIWGHIKRRWKRKTCDRKRSTSDWDSMSETSLQGNNEADKRRTEKKKTASRRRDFRLKRTDSLSLIYQAWKKEPSAQDMSSLSWK